MPVALPGHELTGLELIGQGLGPGVGRGRVTGGAHHEDRRSTGGRDLLALTVRGVAPALAVGVGVEQLGAEGGRGLVDGLGLLLPGGVVPLDRVVQAVDRHEGLSTVTGVAAVALAGGDGVGDGQQRASVRTAHLAHRLGQRQGEGGPQLGLVHRAQHPVDGQVVGQRPLVVGGRQGRRLRGLEELADLGDSGVDVPAQGAAQLGALAVLHVGPQRRLEALGLPQGQVRGAQGGVDGAVEDQPPGVGGEQLGVGGPQVGAVGEAQVGQRLLAVNRPQDVEVLGGTDGVDVVQEPRGAGLRRAGLPHLLSPLLGGGGRGGRRVVRPGSFGVELGVGQAVDRRGGAHATRVEADDVVGAGEILGEVGTGALDQLDARPSRPTRVDEQRADGVLASGPLLHRDLDRLAAGVVVVQRHLDLGAGEAGVLPRLRLAHPLLVTGVPGDLLVVEALQPGRNRCRGRRRCRRCLDIGVVLAGGQAPAHQKRGERHEQRLDTRPRRGRSSHEVNHMLPCRRGPPPGDGVGRSSRQGPGAGTVRLHCPFLQVSPSLGTVPLMR